MKHPTTDIGDYMKVFACTAVIMQSVLNLTLSVHPDHLDQTVIGLLYNLVKFTAPAFIFGILYTTIRTTSNYTWSDYPRYLRKQWSALFIPTICWTLIYLLLFPNVQQHQQFNNLDSFLWQFINGNAAPHLWYNTMMLQFIILMPFFWSLAHWTKNSFSHAIIILSSTIILFSIWIMFYDTFIFHGPQQQSWYLLDRFCVSFFIYAILGLLSYLYRPQLIYCLKKSFPIIIIIFIGSYYWTNRELFSFGFPLKFANAPYYKPSMTLYALMVIALIATLAIKRIRQQAKSLPIIHSLATYASGLSFKCLLVTNHLVLVWKKNRFFLLNFGSYQLLFINLGLIICFCLSVPFYLDKSKINSRSTTS